MAKVYVTQAGGSGGSVATGVLQLQNGVAMTTTLTAVTDQSNTASPLLLSTTGVQTLSKIQISTADTNYIDAEDNSGNNRFTVGRDPASQQVNVDFASNPGGSTELVGGFRTYVDGTNLSNVVNIRRDGQLQIGSTAASAMYWDNTNNRVGIGTATPGVKLDVHSGADNIAQLNRTGAGKSLLQYLLTGTARWATGFDNTNGNYTIYDAVNATDRVVVSNTGRLGVGTNAPAYGVDVQGTASSQIRVKSTNAGAYIDYTNSSGSTYSFGAYLDGFITVLGGSITALLKSDGTNTFGNSLTSLGARVGIKGSGSTGATTSLLVQNSAGTGSIKVTDDGVTAFGSNFLAVRISDEGGSYGRIRGFNGLRIMDDTFTHINMPFASNTRLPRQILIGADTTQDGSSQLQVDSTSKGFLPPRMTNAQRLAIATPAVGLMVYCTDAVEGLYVYKSTGWTFVI